MGRRGVAPAPTALKLLKGTQPSRVNHNEPTPAQGDVVRPEWLGERACEVWDRLAPDMIAKGVLTPWDADSFAQLCQVIVTGRDAMLDIERNGTSLTVVDRELEDGTQVFRVIRNPAWQVARESTAVIVTLGGRFGLNPSDRQQLTVGGRGEADGGERLLS